MFQISNQLLLFLLDASIKAAMLAVIAGLTLKLLQLKDPNVRHRVWTGVLAGMLLLPLLVVFLPTIPLSVPLQWANLAMDNEHASAQRLINDRAVYETHSSTVSVPDEVNTLAIGETYPVDATIEVEDSTITASNKLPATPETNDHAAAALPKWTLSSSLRAVSGILFFIWIAVSIVFALRLAAGLLSSAKLMRRARAIDDPEIAACIAELPKNLSRHMARIRESSEVVVPVTIGWLRPTVLLPQEWQTWTHEKLSAIVAHEFTHVVRRDFFVAVAAEMNRCLYWFHPVSWWLRHQLSELAEEACDDAAIGQTGNRTRYARHLLEVASSLTSGCGRRVQPGLSMARQSNVESRIATILDFKRPLAQRLTWRTTTAIALIAIPVIASAAAIRPVGLTPPAEIQEENAVVTKDTVRIHGQVTDESGKPIPNARVQLWRSRLPDWYAAKNVSKLINELQVDDQGRFDQQIDRNILPASADSITAWSAYRRYGDFVVLVVSAPNYAFTALDGEPRSKLVDGKRITKPGFLKEKVTVQLRPDTTIRGRILSIDARPVAGAAVSVFQTLRSDASRLEAWLKQTSKVPPANADRERMMMGGPVSQAVYFPSEQTFQMPTECIKPVVTNSEGVFELPGLVAKDDLAVLRITGPGITDATVHVLAREMETVYGRQTTHFTSAGAYYGQTFDYITQPSVPVFGVVRDIETKAPLAGVPVAVSSVYGTRMSHEGYIVTETDDQGRYRIEGLPIPAEGTRRYERNSLVVRPTGLPYIENHSIHIPRGDGVNPVEFDIELRQAVMAKGRLVEKDTGEPVVDAELYYAPYIENENTDKYLRYSDGITTMLGNKTRHYTNDDGTFEIPVIPGRGVIAAKVHGGQFVAGYGASDVEAFEDPKKWGANMLSDHIIPSSSHSLKEIDVPSGRTDFEVATMHVDKGISLTVRFVDRDGKPLSGVGGSGLTSDRKFKKFDGDHATASGLAIGQTRPMFFRAKDKSLARHIGLIPEEGQNEVTVTLFPKSRLTGRIVGPEGRPINNVYLEARHRIEPNTIGVREWANTNKNGQFEFLLPVGATYEIIVRTEKYFRAVSDLANDQPKNIDLGDLVLDEQAQRWSTLKSKREPIITDLPADSDKHTKSGSSTKN